MKTTASDMLVDAIHDWDVDVAFGLPGDAINGIMEALRKRADKIRFVQVRHLVQAVVDPYEPPMPPKVTMRQAEKFAESLLKGEPNRSRIVATVAEDKVRELV